MFNLSMGPPEMPEPHRQDKPETSCSGAAPSNDEQFNDMFKVPPKVLECQDQVPVMQPRLDFRTLMAEAQFKCGWRLLPPPPELRKESCSSSAASRSSSTGKRHWSTSRSRDKINPKKGCPTPDREHSTPDKGNTPPCQESPAPAHKFTLNWDQDILEPLKPKWRPAAKDAPATPQYKVESFVKPPHLLAPAKIASCGKGRGLVITEKLKEIAMGPAASSWYTRKDDVPKKTTPKKSSFRTREEMEAHRRCEAWKDLVVNHQEESIGEQYFSIRQQVGRFAQEVKAL